MQGKERETWDNVPWPVRYPAQVPTGEVGERRMASSQGRWPEAGKVKSSDIRKRLTWLLLAVEVGMALAAACVLPLVFMSVPAGEGGIVAALLERAGDARTSSSLILCLGLFLPVPILLLTLALSIGIYRLRQAGGKS